MARGEFDRQPMHVSNGSEFVLEISRKKDGKRWFRKAVLACGVIVSAVAIVVLANRGNSTMSLAAQGISEHGEWCNGCGPLPLAGVVSKNAERIAANLDSMRALYQSANAGLDAANKYVLNLENTVEDTEEKLASGLAKYQAVPGLANSIYAPVNPSAVIARPAAVSRTYVQPYAAPVYAAPAAATYPVASSGYHQVWVPNSDVYSRRYEYSFPQIVSSRHAQDGKWVWVRSGEALAQRPYPQRIRRSINVGSGADSNSRRPEVNVILTSPQARPQW
ncbi:hypothetical protein GUITHDRAFT_139521 [Guillardia theta CCMP2712]|uniref:Uncharacterized protein n=1 Tax=Guillardia theta (strain CCMP2712) TaxID=905079 RepID=L1J919_GUITC|nr:hypothetical protein GUITHDRAFT_139521 [Guillardia theta CCMP2712]EKX44570.1 hypothetical protein GUITHDRAFT_139521 [Guillardia theta CCMP2712]|eukprot:XP_005831550.1 hypothetical protein GUITHDRAFT_139521 [Guillardia theta CCMP2712]